MARELRQSTPVKVIVGPRVDETDGVTPITAFTSAGALDEVAIYKHDSSSFAALSGSLVSISSGGMMRCDMVSADVNTLGNLRLHLRDNDGFLNVWEDFEVVRPAYFDWKYGTSDPPGNVTLKGYASSGVDFSTTQKASINAEADTALSDYDPPTNAEMVARTLVAANYFDPTADNVIVGSYASAGVTPNTGAVTVSGYSSSGSTPLQPTTAGRTLDVTAGGNAGIDWANIAGPTSTVNLSATTVKTATDVETDTADIQSRLPSALTGGNMNVNLKAVNGVAAHADTLAGNLRTVVKGTVQSTGASTAQFQATLLAEGSVGLTSAAGLLNGRAILFQTGTLLGEGVRVGQASSLGSNVWRLVAASGESLTQAPSSGDVIRIV